MKKILSLIILISIISMGPPKIKPVGQNSKYVIFTFHEKYKISQHDEKNYYWILPQDSISTNKFNIARLFISGFSVNNLNDCCNGKGIDPELVRSDEDYHLDTEYIKSINALRQLINNNKIQTIHKKWQQGQEQDIEIYITPILGKFCSANYGWNGHKTRNYNGIVYIPKSDFNYDVGFWNTLEYKKIITQDFSEVKYYIIPN